MNFKEKRRFPRVFIQPALADLVVGLGAQVMWPNLEVSDVTDLSYKGAAVRRPGLFPVSVQMKTETEIRLGLSTPFLVEARLAWCNLEAVGLEFLNLPPEGHYAMTEYIDYKLLGAGLKPVEQAFFNGREGLAQWFQGAGGVHVFVWKDQEDRIDRVSVELKEATVTFERSMKPPPLTNERRRGLLVLSEMHQPAMIDFVRSLMERDA